eukprot:12383298-Alexandrium_andersonii.AAC.1
MESVTKERDAFRAGRPIRWCETSMSTISAGACVRFVYFAMTSNAPPCVERFRHSSNNLAPSWRLSCPEFRPFDR